MSGEEAAESWVNTDIDEFVRSMGLEEEDQWERPSARDVLYGSQVMDYEAVSDAYKRKEMKGNMRVLGHFCNLYFGVVEGEQACTIFFDGDGKVAVKETEFHL